MQLSNGTQQVHIETQTYSAVSAINFDNVFSADYDNYRIVSQFTSNTQSNITLRLRAAGTDASGANYNAQLLNVNGADVTGVRESSQTSYRFSTSNSTGTIVNEVVLSNPFLAKNTFFNPALNARFPSQVHIDARVGNHSLTNSFDGFSILGSTSISGQISVYGLRK